MRIGAGISKELGARSGEKENFRLRAPALLALRLSLQADAEAEDLRVVGVSFDDREGEVQRDRGGAHRRHGDSQAKAGGHAEIVAVRCFGSTVPKSKNATPWIMSSAVSGNRYSTVLRNSKSPPTWTF